MIAVGQCQPRAGVGQALTVERDATWLFLRWARGSKRDQRLRALQEAGIRTSDRMSARE